MKFMTIGYEGLSVQQLLEILIDNRVQVLVDVRESPISRKAGFSKSSLALAVRRCNIEYIHIPELGCPRQIRYAYRADSDWERYEKQFTRYLDTQDAAISDLIKQAQKARCCLMCFEANPRFCHRSLIARRVERMASWDIAVDHLIRHSKGPVVLSDPVAT